MQIPEAAPWALWPPRLAVQAAGDASAPHAHHALHLLLVRDGMLRARVDGGGARSTAGLVTAPDVRHAVDASDRVVVLLFLDPESLDGAALRGTFDGPVRWLEAEERDALLGGLPSKAGAADLTDWMDRVLDRLLGAERSVPRGHPRIRRLLEALRDWPLGEPTDLRRLAAHASLSPTRFMHVFTESVGIPPRPYLRWLRLQRAAGAIVAGHPLAEAAARAGFSDAAHMSRTFKATFGLSPSVLQRRARRAAGRSSSARGARDADGPPESSS